MAKMERENARHLQFIGGVALFVKKTRTFSKWAH